MVIQKTPTKIDKIVSLKIGQRGENLATDIKMDVSDWITVHPDAHYHCLFKRPGEVQVLPVLSSFEDGILTWTVRAWECGVIGVGYLEVRAVDSDTGMVAKSRVIPCSIEDSIIDDEGPVPPEMSWVEEVIEAKNDAEAARDKAQEVLDSIPDDYSALSGEVSSLQSTLTLLEENIPGTVQTIVFDSSGNVQRITHVRNSTVVRTDVFTFATSTITEVRTLATGESLTIVTNTDTLETTTTYADAA